MRIFVAFAFRKEDRWISELVFPLITAFGHTVVTGEDLAGAGQGITDEVKDRIHSCDALIGFTTRRVDEITEQTEVAGRWPTHRWVQDELLYASASSKIPVVEVREAGVRDESGMLEDLQRINYEATARDSCLVNIAKVVGWWS